MPDYYDRSGNNISEEEWQRRYENSLYRLVDSTEVGDYLVSTVWLGLNHNWNPDGPPLVYETMVFGGSTEPQYRWTTEEEAKKNHRSIVAQLKEHLRKDTA
jgi:hypothetical protein